MIGNLKYEDFESLSNTLKAANDNLKIILNNMGSANTSKMKRFTEELDSYIEYLNSTLSLNRDADKALERLKEVSE